MIPLLTTYTCPKCKYQVTKETGCTNVFTPRRCPFCSVELEITKRSTVRPNPIKQVAEILSNIAKILTRK